MAGWSEFLEYFHLVGDASARHGLVWSGFFYFLGGVVLPSFLVIAPLTLTMRYYRHSKRMSKRYFSDYGSATIWFMVILTITPVVYTYMHVHVCIVTLLIWVFSRKMGYELGMDLKTILAFIVMSLLFMILSLGFIISQRALPVTKINKSVIKRTKIIRRFMVTLELLFWRWWILFHGFMLLMLILFAMP